MPVLENKRESLLKIRFENGITEDGKTKYKTKSISGISAGSNNEDLIQVAESLGSLVSDAMSEVNRVDSTELQTI